MCRIFDKEASFEKSLKAGLEERGWYCVHLAGPDGWPDLSCFNYPLNRHIEVKIQRGRTHLREIIENTQAAFFHKHCKSFTMFVVIQYDTGNIGILEVDPSNALPMRNWTIDEFRNRAAEYSVFDNAVKYLALWNRQ